MRELCLPVFDMLSPEAHQEGCAHSLALGTSTGLSLPALPYPAPIFSARASSATVADAVISLSNVPSRPRHAFDTWYFLRGVVWSHDKAGPVQFVHNGEIQHMAQGAPILGLK